MTQEQAKEFITGKMIQIGDKYYRFEQNGKLTISSTELPVYGEYKIITKDHNCYLVTNPAIVGEETELHISILLGDCKDGIIIQ